MPSENRTPAVERDDVVFRGWKESDLPALAELEVLCNPQPWSLAQWQSAHRSEGYTNPNQAWLLFVQNQAIGYACVQIIGDEGELQLLGIHPQSRGMGLGKSLLEHVLREVKAREVSRVFLEVRASNTVARRLYAQAGFRESGLRKAYYASPVEDAVLMELTLA